VDRHIVSKPLVDQVYDAILGDICEGRFAPGCRIRQEDLAAKFGVSRQPVIQALRLLKAQGFLEPHRRKGLQVARLDPQMVRNLYEVREALERVAVKRAAAAPPAFLRPEAEAAIAQGRRAVAEDSAQGLLEADLRFHSALWEAGGNPLIGEAIRGHWAHLRWAMRNVLEVRGYGEQVQCEHEALLEAVCAGEAARATDLMEQHLRNAGAAVVRELEDTDRADKAA